MSDLIAVAYVSNAARPMRPRDLEALLIKARAYNQKVQVSGALLHHQDMFFQYLEGPADAIDQVYTRIKNSPDHNNLVELLNQLVEVRHFSRWHMAFTQAPLTTLQALANEDWNMTLAGWEKVAANPRFQSPGLKMLMTFWDFANPVHPSA